MSAVEMQQTQGSIRHTKSKDEPIIPPTSKKEVKALLNKHYNYVQQEKIQKEFNEKTLKEQQEKAASSIGTLQEFRRYLDDWQTQFQELNHHVDDNIHQWQDISGSASVPAYFTFQTRLQMDRWHHLVYDFIRQADPLVKPLLLEPGCICEENDGLFLFIANFSSDKNTLLKIGEQFRQVAGDLDHAMLMFVSRGPMTKEARLNAATTLKQFSQRVHSGTFRNEPSQYTPGYMQLYLTELPSKKWEIKAGSDSNTKCLDRLGEIVREVSSKQEYTADKESNEEFLRRYLGDMDLGAM